MTTSTTTIGTGSVRGKLLCCSGKLRHERPKEPDPRTHEGYEWFYVLNGRLRVVLAEHDVVLPPGEAAEFDTRVPHWFSAGGAEPAELLCLFGHQGERAHVR